MSYWEIMTIKHEKKHLGICYCLEEKQLGYENKCIFCDTTDSDYDLDFANDVQRDMVKQGNERY